MTGSGPWVRLTHEEKEVCALYLARLHEAGAHDVATMERIERSLTPEQLAHLESAMRKLPEFDVPKTQKVTGAQDIRDLLNEI